MLDTIFSNISKDEIRAYNQYWKTVTPKNNDDIFRRWLFAFTSIHTTWEGNVRGYNAIKDFNQWADNKEKLRELLIAAKCGLYNNRTEYIWDFKNAFFSNPKEFQKKRSESWVDLRDRLMNSCKGIGIAKVSFTLEMCYPHLAEVTCLDTHMIQLYELPLQKFDSGKGYTIYRQYEQDWITRSKALGVSPYITRSIFWDRKQKQHNSRYWSYVLES
jgi:thermostable 8-oxoguanine DNA glycosylase